MSEGVKRGRGRPPIVVDNRRVAAFMRTQVLGAEPDPYADAEQDGPAGWIGDVLIGVAHLQTPGQQSTEPLSRHLLERVLLRCDYLSAGHVEAAIGRGYARGTVGRYFAAARAASKAIARALDQRGEFVSRSIPTSDEAAEFVSPVLEVA